MSNKSIYSWRVDDRASTAMIPETRLLEKIFKFGVTVEECVTTPNDWYEKWCRMERMLPEQTIWTNNTKAWLKNPTPIRFFASLPKDELEVFDFINGILFTPIVSDRVHSLMLDICPNDFEAFDITIDTPTGVIESGRYKLINITHLIYGALNLDRCIINTTRWWHEYGQPYEERDKVDCAYIKQLYIDVEQGKKKKKDLRNIGKVGGGAYTELSPTALQGHDIGRLVESISRCMFSQRLIDGFRSIDANGFAYMPLEDEANMLYGGKIPA